MAQADYYRILTQGERSIQCIKENGEVVMVTEFRKTDGGSRQGHVVIKVGHLATVNASVSCSQLLNWFLVVLFFTFISGKNETRNKFCTGGVD